MGMSEWGERNGAIFPLSIGYGSCFVLREIGIEDVSVWKKVMYIAYLDLTVVVGNEHVLM